MHSLIAAPAAGETAIIVAIALVPLALLSLAILLVLRPFDPRPRTEGPAARPARAHFRPFGLAGSAVEVFIGYSLLASVLWTDESYSRAFTVTLTVLGGLVLLVGIIGVLNFVRFRLRN